MTKKMWPKVYTEAFKRQVIEFYLTHDFSKKEVWEKFTGYKTEHGKILSWMRKYGYMADKKNSKGSYSEKSSTEFNKLVESERIRQLEDQLREAELKAIAFSKMIDIAEESFKISIRKKYNTKPSKQ